MEDTEVYRVIIRKKHSQALEKIVCSYFWQFKRRFGAKSRWLIKAPSVGKHERLMFVYLLCVSFLHWKEKLNNIEWDFKQGILRKLFKKEEFKVHSHLSLSSVFSSQNSIICWLISNWFFVWPKKRPSSSCGSIASGSEVPTTIWI